MAKASAGMLLPAVSFERLFKSDDPPRDKFLSRLFGIFGEEFVRIWASCDWAPYEDLGRPTARPDGDARGMTLDFALRSRRDGRVFMTEMKCPLERRKYTYLTLTEQSQHAIFANDTFQRFFALAGRAKDLEMWGKRRRLKTSGAILVWGSATAGGKRALIDRVGLHDVLSLEDIIDDLIRHAVPEYLALLNERAAWCEDMFGVLGGHGLPLREDDA
ncbi:MAG: hypothetical protein WEE64_06600 [Dehalococcoidia bacterium]